MENPCKFNSVFYVSLFFGVMIGFCGQSSYGASDTQGLPRGNLVQLTVCKSPGVVTNGEAKGKAVRLLRMYEQKGENPCLATYSKSNVEKMVGVSRYPRGCQGYIDGIRKNLEASHWECRNSEKPNILMSAKALEQEQKLQVHDGDTNSQSKPSSSN